MPINIHERIAGFIFIHTKNILFQPAIHHLPPFPYRLKVLDAKVYPLRHPVLKNKNKCLS